MCIARGRPEEFYTLSYQRTYGSPPYEKSPQEYARSEALMPCASLHTAHPPLAYTLHCPDAQVSLAAAHT